tara:strand:+ start:1706 stop:2590 length:885 start_codon:yes stop_codon:yes gene_type:complete
MNSYDNQQIEMNDSEVQINELNTDPMESVSDQNNLDKNITVVKIGGSTLGEHDTTLSDLVQLQKDGQNPVVVHGGGKIVSEWMEKQGVKPKFVDGLRVTDSQSLDIVTSVLTGLINKNLVSSIIKKGGNAVGISGVDGQMISAKITDPKLGFVGEVTEINSKPIFSALNSGFIPVIAPVGVNVESDDDESPNLLNINADTVAGNISAALSANTMLFLTDVEGVLDSSRRLIPRITRRQADSLVKSKIIAGGMIPKIQACVAALDGGAKTYIVDGRLPGALTAIIKGQTIGTRIG